MLMTPAPTLALPVSTRWRMHVIPAFAVVFLAIYGKTVCPFITTISLQQVMTGLAAVGLVHIGLREMLMVWWPARPDSNNPARHYFRLSMMSWFAAGLVAVLVHHFLYPDFPPDSHLKLLVGYWALGAGILSQVEYIAIERHFRRRLPCRPSALVERITRRLMEGYGAIVVVPVMVLVMMAARFVYEGYAHRGTVIEVAFLGGCFVAASLFMAWRFGNALREDCDHILSALNEVEAGRYNLTVDSSRPDELGRVAAGINDMASGLALRERIRDAFGRFVDPAIAEKVIRDINEDGQMVVPGGVRQDVTVLMADIRDFTALAETIEPEALTALLNGYFTEMVGALSGHGAMVDKFIGDAVMAVFGLDGRPDHAHQAIRAATAMRTRLKAFNEALAKDGKAPLENGIGLHSGPVVAGLIGSAERLEFTIIGATVNLAARIESQARRPNPAILLSEEVARRIGNDIPVEIIGTAKLKGIGGDTILYTLSHGEAALV